MKKLLVLLMLIPFIVNGQDYFDIGVRISKFNSGLTTQVAIGGVNGSYENPWGIEGFAGVTNMADWGPMASLMGYKEWNLIQSKYSNGIFLKCGIGAQILTVKNYFWITEDQKGAVPYPNLWTTSVGICSVLGIEYICTNFPITLCLSTHPWRDIINPGPEFIDVSFSLKYQIEPIR